MNDKMKPIKGYFKVEKINQYGEIIYEYEDKNTVMIRIPELLAGQVSGLYKKEVPNYTINTIALGTNGIFVDNENEMPKTVNTKSVSGNPKARILK